MAFKICIIGCGGISGNVHGPSYVKYKRENPDAVLAACCDLNRERAEAYRKKFGFTACYTDYKEMLRVEKPDAVCVTVDEDHTAEVGVDVLNLGFPMFIEKPPGKDSAETMALIRAARESGVINQVGYNRRFLPMFREMKRMMAEETGAAESESAESGVQPCQTSVSASIHASGKTSGASGRIQFVRYDFYRVARYDIDFSDTAVHGIDAVRYIAGADYKKVHFSYQPLPRFGEGVKNIYMDCVMTNGARAQLSFCPVTGVVLERATVHADDATWMAHTPIWGNGIDMPGELIYLKHGETVARIPGADICGSGELYITNGFYDENKEFFDNVRAGRKCACDLENALNTSLIKDCITNGAERLSR